MNLGIIGIELGTTQVLVSFLSGQGIQIIESESSSREIPSYVSYREGQRLFSEQALARIKTNYLNTIRFPFRYLKSFKGADQSNLDIRQVFSDFSIDDTSGRISFSVNYNGENQKFEAFQVAAGFISFIQKLIIQQQQENGVNVIAVPSSFTYLELASLKKAVEISGFVVSRYIYEHEALAQAYLYQLKADLKTSDIPVKILVIDVGYASTSAFLTEFQGLTANILMVRSLGDVGVRNIDYQVYEFLVDNFEKEQQKTNQSFVFPRTNQQIELRLMNEIQEKLRKNLSLSNDSVIHIEDFCNGSDLEFKFTRELFEKVCNESFTKQFAHLLGEFTSFIEQFNIPLDNVEILGGGVRIPFVQNLIRETFKRERLGVAFTEESVSRGATIEAVQLTQILFPNTVLLDNYVVNSCFVAPIQIRIEARNEVLYEQIFKQDSRISCEFQNTISFELKPSVLTEYLKNEEFEQNKQQIEIEDGNQKNLMTLQITETDEYSELQVKNPYSIQTFLLNMQKQKIPDDYQSTQFRVEIQMLIKNNFEFEITKSSLISSNQVTTEQPEEIQVQEQVPNQKETEPEADINIPNTENQQQPQQQEGKMQEEEAKVVQKENPQPKRYTTKQITKEIVIHSKARYDDQLTPEAQALYKSAESKKKQRDDEITRLKEHTNQFQTLVLNVKQTFRQKYQVVFTEQELSELQTFLDEGEKIREILENNHFADVPLEKMLDCQKNLLILNQSFNSRLHSLDQDIVSFKTLGEIKDHLKVVQKNKNHPPSNYSFQLRNQHIGDGGGFTGIFKSKGKPFFIGISSVTIQDSLIIELGNTAISDTGLNSVIESIQSQNQLTQLKIDCYTPKDGQFKNEITQKSIGNLVGLIKNFQNLMILELDLNQINQPNFVQLFQIIKEKLPMLQSVQIDVRNGDFSEKIAHEFVDFCQNAPHIQQGHFIYYNIEGIRVVQYDKH